MKIFLFHDLKPVGLILFFFSKKKYAKNAAAVAKVLKNKLFH